MSDLAAVLPRLLSLAVAWVERQEHDVLATGRVLSDVERQLAAAVGVHHPDRVRFKVVNQLPQPAHPELLAVADQTGLLGQHMAGVTFGHAIFVRHGQVSNRLVSRELRHVRQYETAGSIV